MAARDDEARHAKKSLVHVLLRQGLSNDDVGVARVASLQEARPVEPVSKPAITLKKS